MDDCDFSYGTWEDYLGADLSCGCIGSDLDYLASLPPGDGVVTWNHYVFACPQINGKDFDGATIKCGVQNFLINFAFSVGGDTESMPEITRYYHVTYVGDDEPTSSTTETTSTTSTTETTSTTSSTTEPPISTTPTSSTTLMVPIPPLSACNPCIPTPSPTTPIPPPLIIPTTIFGDVIFIETSPNVSNNPLTEMIVTTPPPTTIPPILSTTTPTPTFSTRTSRDCFKGCNNLGF